MIRRTGRFSTTVRKDYCKCRVGEAGEGTDILEIKTAVAALFTVEGVLDAVRRR